MNLIISEKRTCIKKSAKRPSLFFCFSCSSRWRPKATSWTANAWTWRRPRTSCANTGIRIPGSWKSSPRINSWKYGATTIKTVRSHHLDYLRWNRWFLPITGNGYIEGTELDGFLREFVSSANSSDIAPEVSFLRVCFFFIGTLSVGCFRPFPTKCCRSSKPASWRPTTTIKTEKSTSEKSENNNYKYITTPSKFSFQLAQLLPMEENFLLLFRFDNPLESSVEFMKVGWSERFFATGFQAICIFRFGGNTTQTAADTSKPTNWR